MSQQRRPDASMELLNSILENSVDPEYAMVAASNKTPRKLPITVIVVSMLAGLLIAAYAAHNQLNAASAADERQELISRVEQKTTERNSRVDLLRQLRKDNTKLQEQAIGKDSHAGLQHRSLTGATGAGSLAGPGVVIDVKEPPHSLKPQIIDQDLRQLVNGLWQAGAEGIAINGQRVTSMTAIREAGLAITVNYVSISPPYRLEVIGDSNQIPGRFTQTSAGSWWNYLTQNYGVSITFTQASEVILPGESTLNVRLAKPVG